MQITKRQQTILWSLATLPLIALFFWSFRQNFWISDDAYILFRTIENFQNGDGLRWNVAERVQTYTCPLWLFSLLPFSVMTGDPYLAALVLSASMAAATVLVTALHRPFPGFLIFFISLALSSRAFTDYSSSGLENPLSHFLVALFYSIWFFRPTASPALLTGIAGLAFLNRMDSALLFAGPLLQMLITVLRERDRYAHLRQMALTLVPVLLWLAFSLIYYGSPVPNTYYAKMNHHAGIGATLRQGIYYVHHLVLTDPLTAFMLGLSVMMGLFHRPGRCAAASIALHAFYVLSVGGDFMEGRMFSASFVAALLSVARLLTHTHAVLKQSAPWLALLALALTTNLVDGAPLRTTGAYGNFHVVRGIADEKGQFYYATSLNTILGQPPLFPAHDWARMGQDWKDKGKTLTTIYNPGFSGYQAGRSVHIVDRLALTDPLLSRITGFAGRIGHIERLLPADYLASLAAGTNEMKDPDLARLFDDVMLVTRGPLWSMERLAAMLRLGLQPRGGYSAPYPLDPGHIQEIRQREPPPSRLSTLSDAELTRHLFRIRENLRFPEDL